MTGTGDIHGDSNGGSAGRSSGGSRTRRPPPGPPAEVWLWRIEAMNGRGEHRTLADNVRADHWEEVWVHRHPGAGRYRIEFRDARRAIVKVEYANVPDPRSSDPIVYTTGRVRRPQRTVPPPSKAWEPRRLPSPAAPPRSTPTRTAPATPPAPAAHPPLDPPGAAPPDTYWCLRKSGRWKPVDRDLPLLKNYARLWLDRSREVILVYTPDGSWPGHEEGRLRDGRSCLFLRATRR